MSQYRNKRKYLYQIGVIILIIVVFWFLFSWIKKFKTTSIPVYKDVVALSLESKQSLIKKVTSLDSELEARKSELVALDALSKENAELKAQLGREDHIKGSILARVINSPGSSIYGTINIDSGIDEGISIGQTVYAFGSIALGTISEVYQHSSTVSLFSSSGRETSGTVSGSNIVVTLIGRGDGEYEVRMPRDIVFEQGGVITMQSLAVHPIATIQKIVTDPRDPFQRLLAKAPVNLQTMKWVMVK